MISALLLLAVKSLTKLSRLPGSLCCCFATVPEPLVAYECAMVMHAKMKAPGWRHEVQSPLAQWQPVTRNLHVCGTVAKSSFALCAHAHVKAAKCTCT